MKQLLIIHTKTQWSIHTFKQTYWYKCTMFVLFKNRTPLWCNWLMFVRIKVIFIVNSVETMTKVVFKKTIVIYFLFSHHYLKLVKKQKTWYNKKTNISSYLNNLLENFFCHFTVHDNFNVYHDNFVQIAFSSFTFYFLTLTSRFQLLWH